MSFSDADLTLDHFLDGRLKLWQPRHGYRAATDPILLAAAVEAKAGQSVLELGCGAGAGLFALGRRVEGLKLTGVERQTAYAELARRNSKENNLFAEIIEADVMALPSEAKRAFDHVITNPPWFSETSPAARDGGRDMAQREALPVGDWLRVALARVKQGGYLTLIHLIERLPSIIAALNGPAGAIAVRPLTSRAGRDAGRVIVQARKGARGPFRLLAPLVLHAGAQHPGDREHFTPETTRLLRECAALGWKEPITKN